MMQDVSFPLAKDADDLYDELADYDLVVVPDAPLASALNRRLDQPHLGPFAITPRRLAAGRRERSEDRLAFLELVQQTDLDWKRAAHAVGDILQCWEHQGSLDAILEYDAHVDDATRLAVEHVGSVETTSSQLTAHQIGDDQTVAVVGYDQLTQLERSILPGAYDTVSPFTAADFDRPQFHVFDSPTAIVDTVVDSITPENAADVAVVLDRNSEYSSLVESGLEAAGVPFYGGPGFADDPDHRAFVQLLRAAHRGPGTRVREVKSLFASLDANVGVDHDEKRLVEVEDPTVESLVSLCGDVAAGTFAEALDAFERRANCRLESFREELETLDLADERVTGERVDELAFYLQTYDVPVERENEGVLLADAKSAAYVDRPVVFYLGLDDGWTHSPPQRPWVDQDAQYTRNLKQFQMLLQSGANQYYLVQDAKGGSPVTPCLYFEELVDEDFERFSDLDSTTHAPRFDQAVGGFEREPIGEVAGNANTSRERVDAISQSSLSTYVNSPRDYFFGRLLDQPEKDYFAVGNLFHDFAEFYATHPSAVGDEEIEEAVEVFLEDVTPFLRPVDEQTARTKYRVGLENVAAFLDEHAPEDDSFLTPASGWGTNRFAEHFGKPVNSPLTERWFENDDLGLKGKIDLVGGPTQLVDHKSGRRKRASEVVKQSAIDPPSDTPNYQALLYLTHWRTKRPGERLSFTFFHLLETLDDVVAGEPNLDDALTTVAYYPRTFEEHARSREVFEDLVEDGAGNCRKTLSKVEYDEYAGVFDDVSMPDTRDRDELIDSAFGDRLISRLKECVGDYNYVESGCEQAMRELMRIRNRNYFADDLDAFESFVDERLDELNRRRAGEQRFPVEGLGGEPNYRRVDNRDLLLEDDR